MTEVVTDSLGKASDVVRLGWANPGRLDLFFWRSVIVNGVGGVVGLGCGWMMMMDDDDG